MSVEYLRPSWLSRLIALAVMALAVGAGILVLVPVVVLGLALLVSFGVYLFLHRLLSRLGRAGSEGRRNVRVVVRDSER